MANFDGIADGYLNLASQGVMEAATPGVSEFAAAGNLSLSGDEAAYDTTTPGVSKFIAAGSLGMGGKCVLTVVLPTQFAASGALALIGACQLTSQPPEPPETLLPYDFAAAGYLGLTAECQVSIIPPSVAEFVADGYLRLGGAFLASMAVFDPSTKASAFVSAGGMDLTGAGAMDAPRGPVSAFVAATGAGGIALLLSSNSSVGFLSAPVAAFRAAGEMLMVDPDAVLEELFETWALTGQAYEPALYSGFDFNSYCVYRGRAYGAKDDGIYLLEGDDDAGKEIHSGVRIGPHNFGTDRQKRLRSLRLGGNAAEARVRVVTGDGRDGYFDSDRGRVLMSRDLEDREFIIDISDFNELAQLEIIPLVLMKR